MEGPEVEIVLLDDAHIGHLRHVAPDVFDHAVSQEHLSAYIKAPGHLLLIAVAGGLVVAQVAAVIHHHIDRAPELYIDNVGVTPKWQRRGLARRMLRRMFALGRDRGCVEAWVGTEVENAPARALYEQLGDAGEPFMLYLYDLVDIDQ